MDDPKSVGGSTELRTPSKPQDEEGKGRMWPGGSRGLPTPLGLEPPLFDAQQLQRMRDLERKAPMLMKREVEFARPEWMAMEDLQQARRMSSLAGLRPTWFAEEERKQAEEESQRERFRHQQLKYQMLNDEEKLILLRNVHCSRARRSYREDEER